MQPFHHESGALTNNLSSSYSFHKSLYHKSLSLTPQLIPHSQFWNANPEKKKNNPQNPNIFRSLKYSAGTQHGNLHQLSVTMSRVTCFILQACAGTSASHSQHRINLGEVSEKMQVNGPDGQKLARKKSLAVSVACMAIYGPAQGLKRENL